MTRALRERGCMAGRHRVARIMQEMGLYAFRKRRYRRATDDSSQLYVADNLLDQQFHVARRNQVWASDTTTIPTDEGLVYLAIVMDLYSRKIVGWSLDNQHTDKLTTTALRRAIQMRKPPRGLLLHSDQGRQYLSHKYRQLVDANHLRQSMSHKGCCWDNAVVESFFKSLKVERVYRVGCYDNLPQAKRDVAWYIDRFYNPIRLHSYLDYTSPSRYEERQD